MTDDTKVYDPNPAPLPCPICGAEAITACAINIHPHNGKIIEKWHTVVYCENCRPRMESVHFAYENESSLAHAAADKRAIKSWNNLVKTIKEREGK